MSAPAFDEVAAAERKFLDSLRVLTPDAQRRLLDELREIAREPRCDEFPADSGPCPSHHTSCERCARFTEVLERLYARMVTR
jgi:hypothetical protein